MPVMVLTHGAGSNRDAPMLVALDGALTQAGVDVRRVNLAFREKRSSGSPGSGDAEKDRAGLRSLLESLRPGRVFLGGHSYGGRQSTMLAAEDPAVADALLLMSYPLHPPGRAAELRTGHLPDLRTQSLFVHGSRDPFGSIAEMEGALKLIPARTRLIEITGGGHELARRRLEEVAKRIADEFLSFVG